MLIVSNINKRFRGAEAPILKDITFTVNAGERVGLIGPNGSGKSTLLKLITGHEDIDSGTITTLPPALRIGYLAQGLTVPDDTPVHDVLYPQGNTLRALEDQLEALGNAIAEGIESALEAYNDVLERMTQLSGVEDSGEGEKMLAELGLDHVALDTPVGQLSGGQKTRLILASILLDRPQLLVLDEPTNHLDIRALTWLENWLSAFGGGVLVVSHDRTFIDRVCNRVVALNPLTQTARVFVGGYSDYLDTLASEREKQWALWHDQQLEIARMQYDIQKTMQRAQRKENATVNDHQRRYAKKVARRGKSKEKRLERYMESDKRVDRPNRTWDVKIDFDRLPKAYGDVLLMDKLSIGYDGYNPLLNDLSLIVQGGERIAIMGPNGHGKSTLLKTIMGELSPVGGSVRLGSGVQVGYLAQEQEILDPGSTPLSTLQEDVHMGISEARSFLHYFLFAGDEVFRPNHLLSYGERARLMLALLVARGANLLVMDEPLNHLDLPAREQFEQALQGFPGSVLAVVHDRYFVEKFATSIWHIEEGALQVEIREVAEA